MNPDPLDNWKQQEEDRMIARADEAAEKTDWPEALRAWTKTNSRECPIEEIYETLNAYDLLRAQVDQLTREVERQARVFNEGSKFATETITRLTSAYEGAKAMSKASAKDINRLEQERDEFHRCLLAREKSLAEEGERWVKAKTECDEAIKQRDEARAACAQLKEASRGFTDEIWAHVPEEQWRNPPVLMALEHLQSVRNSITCGTNLLSALKECVAACQKALNWATGKGEYSDGRDTISELAEEVAPALNSALTYAKPFVGGGK